jgi:hypothetical protein
MEDVPKARVFHYIVLDIHIDHQYLVCSGIISPYVIISLYRGYEMQRE